MHRFLLIFIAYFQCMQASCNVDTLPIYDDIGPAGLKIYAEVVGLQDCPDLAPLATYIKPASTILEIGGGYGRIVEGLLKAYPNKSIIVLEQAENNYAHLSKIFNSQEKVKVLKNSIMDYEGAPQSLDVALWMWSGYADLNFSEQKLALNKLFNLLKPSGLLAIDLPDGLDGALATNQGEIWYMVLPSGKRYEGHIPYPNTMNNDARAAGFETLETIKYTTPNHSDRVIYLLKRSI